MDHFASFHLKISKSRFREKSTELWGKNMKWFNTNNIAVSEIFAARFFFIFVIFWLLSGLKAFYSELTVQWEWGGAGRRSDGVWGHAGVSAFVLWINCGDLHQTAVVKLRHSEKVGLFDLWISVEPADPHIWTQREQPDKEGLTDKFRASTKLKSYLILIILIS